MSAADEAQLNREIEGLRSSPVEILNLIAEASSSRRAGPNREKRYARRGRAGLLREAQISSAECCMRGRARRVQDP
jgi:hypothetical protein